MVHSGNKTGKAPKGCSYRDQSLDPKSKSCCSANFIIFKIIAMIYFETTKMFVIQY